MAKPRMDLSAFVGKLLEEQDGDVLREGIRVLSQALIVEETLESGSFGAIEVEPARDMTPREHHVWWSAKLPRPDAAEQDVGRQSGLLNARSLRIPALARAASSGRPKWLP